MPNEFDEKGYGPVAEEMLKKMLIKHEMYIKVRAADPFSENVEKYYNDFKEAYDQVLFLLGVGVYVYDKSGYNK